MMKCKAFFDTHALESTFDHIRKLALPPLSSIHRCI